MSKSFSWHGAENIRVRLSLFNTRVNEQVLKIFSNGMLQIAGRMKSILTDLEHIDTGNLRRSCTGGAKRASLTTIEGYVKAGDIPSGIDYAPYVEALPDGGFFWRAIEEMTPLVQQDMLIKLKRVIDQ